jgi:hypothetical protein
MPSPNAFEAEAPSSLTLHSTFAPLAADFADFDVFVPCDVNAAFYAAPLEVPDPNAPQNAPATLGYSDAAQWRAFYKTNIMPFISQQNAAYSADLIEVRALRDIFANIIAQLFLGVDALSEEFQRTNVKFDDSFFIAWLDGLLPQN